MYRVVTDYGDNQDMVSTLTDTLTFIEHETADPPLLSDGAGREAGNRPNMKILVLGGAGYIGSHMVRFLAEQNADVVVFDNLSTGHRFLAGPATLVAGDILDTTALAALFGEHGPFDAVIHFCAKSLVGESVVDPALYYRNNLVGTLNLLDTMRATGHRRIVFSSTAAVYGIPHTELIDELQPLQPINPYGRSKLMIERILEDHAAAYGFDATALRYFNAAGAHPDGDIGELHQPETHLIPNVLKAVQGGPPLKIFGTDYPTADGSCVRDYVHVCDLAAAHWQAIGFMKANPGMHAFNLGNGQGFSVLEVIRCVERVTGRPVPREIALRRVGDPPRLVADATRARDLLGWRPRQTDLEDIVASAWRFHERHGFGSA